MSPRLLQEVSRGSFSREQRISELRASEGAEYTKFLGVMWMQSRSARETRASRKCTLLYPVQGRGSSTRFGPDRALDKLGQLRPKKNCVACEVLDQYPSFLLYPPPLSSLTTSEMDVREWPLIISRISIVDRDSDLFSSLITFNLCTICSSKRLQMILLSLKLYAVLHFANSFSMFT